MEKGPRVRDVSVCKRFTASEPFPRSQRLSGANRTDGGRVGFVENAMMNPVRVLGLAALATLASLSGAQAQEPPTGTWPTEGGEIRVRIAKCASAYCGTIVWERKESQD